jgi:hypothetical protein
MSNPSQVNGWPTFVYPCYRYWKRCLKAGRSDDRQKPIHFSELLVVIPGGPDILKKMICYKSGLCRS